MIHQTSRVHDFIWKAGICAMVTLAAPVLASGESDRRVITSMGDVWCPYTCEADARNPGFFVELVDVALRGSRFKSQFKNVVWERAMVEAKTGRADIILALAAAEGGDEIDTSFYSLRSPTCGFTKPDSKKLMVSVSDLDSFESIGVIKGYSYGDNLESYLSRHDLPKGKVQVLSAKEPAGTNLKRVEAGRLEIALEDPAVVAYWSKEIGIGALKNVGCSPDIVPVYLGLSKNSKYYPDLANALREGLKSAKKSGEISRLLKKYQFK